jgi:hypothetical protein
MPFGHLHHNFFCAALLRKIRLELLPQQSSVCAHNAVFAGVVSGGPAKNANPNLLFGGLFRHSPNGTFSHIEKKLAKPRGRLQMLA